MDENRALYENLKKYAYYFIILVVSLIATCFLPLINSSIEGGFVFPSTWNDWLVFITARLIIGFINITIFYCFLSQAEVNVQDDENYKKANLILNRIKEKKMKIPRSPNKFKSQQWITKGTMIFLSSLGATFVFTNVILKYDLVQLLVYIFTIVMGVIFGYLTQRKNELYWRHEYLDYALREEAIAKEEKEKEENVHLERENLQDVSGTSIEKCE